MCILVQDDLIKLRAAIETNTGKRSFSFFAYLLFLDAHYFISQSKDHCLIEI